ncbi:MAG: hypothetical protein CL916_08865 [Deltaproteobacteria bacterium]|nr:hypothetical protein [Deltaproteobacteria bacterium]
MVLVHHLMMDKVYPKIFFLFLLSWLPFVSHVWSGNIVGAGPDVVSTLWGMWWFQYEGVGSIFGAQSTVLNYPFGATGVVLAPSSAMVWSLSDYLLGVGYALLLASWIQVVLLVWACALLAKKMDGDWFFAALTPLIGTYLFFGIGEGSLVAIACAPLVFGLYSLIRQQEGSWLHSIFTGFCMVWMALENPYLAPILPIFTSWKWVMAGKNRAKCTLSLLIGGAGVLYMAAMFGAAANPDYPREVAGQEVALLGRAWQIVDLPWARMEWSEFVWPETVRWTTGADNATQASGGRYLGLSVILLAIYGLKKSHSGRWMMLSVTGILLSMGSLMYGMAFPFLFLNHVMDVLARPLTQPTRYLCLAVIGFSICCSLAVVGMSQKQKISILVCFLLDSFFFGSLSLQLPQTTLPDIPCSLTGPTLLYPWDARDGELSQAQLYQLVHEKPAAHTGIASWALPEGKRAMDKVRGAGFGEGSSMIRFSQLYRLGYRWILSQEKLRGRGAKEERCGSYWVYELRKS